MSVHVDLVLDDDTAAVLRRDADERGIDFGQAVAGHVQAARRRIEGDAAERYIEGAEAERIAAGCP